MSNGNGSKFDPDAFAKALEPAFRGLAQSFSERIDRLDQSLGGRIDALDANLSGRIDALDANLSGRIDALGDRLESAIENQGGHWRDLSARVDRLESAVFPPKKS
jgi:hypothetical protein